MAPRLRSFALAAVLASPAAAQTVVRAPVLPICPTLGATGALAPSLSPAQSLTLPAIPAFRAPAAAAAAPSASFHAAAQPAHAAVPAVPAAQPVAPEGAVRPSRPGFTPHGTEPVAFLPDGTPLPPDSYAGGFHGTDRVSPEEVQRLGGLPARGPYEDWRLLDHVSQENDHVSAFRGTTQFVLSPTHDAGAALWATAGGWVYELRGVPTWDLNADLQGRVRRPDGTWKGNQMEGETESAVPAQVPIECIPRWGQVRENSMGTLYVPAGDWTANPRFDLARCLQFWGAAN